MNAKSEGKDRREYLREALRDIFPPGSTVYTVLLHVSRSGMLRIVRVLAETSEGIQDVSHLVAELIGFGYDQSRRGVRVRGCGMDAGFEVVYNLSYALYADGWECLGDRCSSPDHINLEVTAECIHKDGYALRHRWI